jgi:hypothetical protein
MLSRFNRASLLSKSLMRNQTRTFAAQGQLTDELKAHLKRLGFSNFDRFVQNPT